MINELSQVSPEDQLGMLMPAGSHCAQFLVERQAHKIQASGYPFVVWVDRRPGPPMRSCGGSPSWTVIASGDGSDIIPAPGTYAGVCLCMGRFIE